MEDTNLLHVETTESIIKCFYKVYNTLKYGFLEKVYENALKNELEKTGHRVESQKQIKVLYYGKVVGEYYADLIVDDKVILELKSAVSICEEHVAQLVNYLRATEIEVGLLLNFGKEPKFARRAFENEYKKSLKSV